MSNRVRHLVRFVRNRSCGVRKCKNAHLSMRVFRCPCTPPGAPHSRRAPASRLPPRCAPCAPPPCLPPRGKVSRSDGRGELAPFLSFLLRRPARPFINHQNKNPVTPCCASSCTHTSTKQKTPPRVPLLPAPTNHQNKIRLLAHRPAPLYRSAKQKTARRMARRSRITKSKDIFYFFPFQQ